MDRRQDVHGSRLLEASAGTGKTFAIENIVVRLMVEEPSQNQEPLRLDQILVVTFTNPATYDLKVRIRSNIVRCINILTDALKGKSSGEGAPDYLKSILENIEHAQRAKQKLEQGLACFEEAPIYTIHSFCSRMLREYVLEGGQAFQDVENDGQIAPSKIRRLIKDFFLTEIRPQSLTKGQLDLVLGSKDAEHLETKLYKVIIKWMDIAPVPEPISHYQSFAEKMRHLKEKTGLTSAHILEEFLRVARHHNGICSKDNIPKPENLKRIERLAGLFDKKDWDIDDFDILLAEGPGLCQWLHPGNRKARIKSGVNPQAQFYDSFHEALAPLIEKASNPDLIFAWMAKECRKLILDYLDQEEIASFDMILHDMKDALENPAFADKIRGRFKAAIVDEFQDTDPVQWEIFKRLFMQEGSLLYLVGDPKQSIYAFRQADIYTYLKASSSMGSNRQSSLDTNYRSQPGLVAALNALFDPATAPGLISLPRLDRSLTYQPVKAGAKPFDKPFSDGKGCLHFFTVEYQKKKKEQKLPNERIEADFFFPFICQEILHLHRSDNIQYKQFAVLVKDRFQAQKLLSFMAQLNIPATLQRTSSLADSKALSALKELLQGILTPRDESCLKTALGGPIIGYTHKEILELSNHERWEKALAGSYALRKKWMDDGFAVFFEELLQSRWLASGESIGEHLLLQENGAEFYQDLIQIAELIVEYEALSGMSPNKCLEFLHDFDKLDKDEDVRLKRRIDPNRDAVKVLTLHASKGLEFDIVFALGLFNRTKEPEGLIPDSDGQAEPKLIAIKDESDINYQSYCDELDAEKIRQLYVALTRAKYRLYIPIVFYQGGSCERGTASPMELYLARLCHSHEDQDLYPRILNSDPTFFYAFLEKLKASFDISYSRLQDQLFDLQADKLEVMPHLCVPRPPVVPGCELYMHSFTTLSKHKSQKGDSQVFLEGAPHDFLSLIKSPHTLPTGSETGNLLHEILEKIPFNAVLSAASPVQIYPLLKKSLAGTPYEMWPEVVSDIIFNALKTDLGVDGTDFSLSQLKEGEYYREHEFMYSAEGSSVHPEFSFKAGFVKGVIDLIFTRGGKYYLLDWKSNWLGPGPEHYTNENMERAMHENQYFLQASLYKEALKRYLKIVDGREFGSIFGGVLYVFLRGLDNDGTKGIYKIYTEMPC